MINETIIDYLSVRGVMRELDILDLFPNESMGKVQHALSELSQDKKITRMIYKLPGSVQERSLYFPFGTKIE
jgi:hypothetical protein